MVKNVTEPWYKACLLLENAKLTAGISRRQHTRHGRVFEKLPRFFIMRLHYSLLHFTTAESLS